MQELPLRFAVFINGATSAYVMPLTPGEAAPGRLPARGVRGGRAPIKGVRAQRDGQQDRAAAGEAVEWPEGMRRVPPRAPAREVSWPRGAD